MPDVRRIVGRLVRRYGRQSAADQRSITDWLLGQGSDEAAHIGLLLLGRNLDAHDTFPIRALDRFAGALRDWAATDTFCTNVLHPLLLREPERVLPLLDQWTTARSTWKRRSSVVAFARKVGETGRFTQQGLAICERLIDDNEDLVRKGIGWALKDMMKGDRAPVLDYVASLRRRGVSSVITLYAIKDLVGAERARLLAVRKDL